MKTGVLSLLALAAGAAVAQAQVAFTGQPVVIDFDSALAGVNAGQFTGAGFSPTPSTGQLDSDAWAVTGLSDGDLAFGGSGTTGDYARGTSAGGVTTGGIYAFQVGGPSNVGLGVQPSGADFTPGSLKLRIQNQTGSTLVQLRVQYTLYVRNDEDRATTWTVAYSTDDLTYTTGSGQGYTSPTTADTSPLWTAVQRDFMLTGLSVAAGGYLYLSWDSDDPTVNPGSGSRDEFALDDIVLTVPEPGSAGWTALVLLAAGLVGRRRGAGGSRIGW